MLVPGSGLCCTGVKAFESPKLKAAFEKARKTLNKLDSKSFFTAQKQMIAAANADPGVRKLKAKMKAAKTTLQNALAESNPVLLQQLLVAEETYKSSKARSDSKAKDLNESLNIKLFSSPKSKAAF